MRTCGNSSAIVKSMADNFKDNSMETTFEEMHNKRRHSIVQNFNCVVRTFKHTAVYPRRSTIYSIPSLSLGFLVQLDKSLQTFSDNINHCAVRKQILYVKQKAT